MLLGGTAARKQVSLPCVQNVVRFSLGAALVGDGALKFLLDHFNLPGEIIVGLFKVGATFRLASLVFRARLLGGLQVVETLLLLLQLVF